MKIKFLLNFSSTNSESNLRILSWNINGVHNKFSNMVDVIPLLNLFDIIFLSECKTPLPINALGFESFLNPIDNSSTSGGVAILIRHHMIQNISYMDCSERNKIWFRLNYYSDILFGGIYIYPNNSQYFNSNDLAEIQAKLMANNNRDFVLFGDFNARLGQSNTVVLNNLLKERNISSYTYRNLADPILRPNPNGRSLINIFKQCNIFPINGVSNYNKTFYSGLTFRKKEKMDL